jgi:uncharacterized protein (TIRG00374 family)
LRYNSGLKALRIGAGLVVVLFLVYSLARQVDVQEIARRLKGADILWTGVALLSVGATLWIRAMRWQVLLASHPSLANSAGLARLIAAGQVLNTFVPARTGELFRAYVAGKAGAEDRLYALGTIGAEKLLDVLLWFILLGGVLLWVPLPAWVMTGAIISWWVFVTLVGLLALSVAFRKALRGWLSRPVIPQVLTRWLEALGRGVSVLRQPGVLLTASLWSLLLWGAYVFNNWAVFRALHIERGLAGAVLVLVILQAGIAPPSTPAKIGVFEYLCVLALGLLGLSSEASLSYGMVLHLVILIPPLAWGVPALVRPG